MERIKINKNFYIILTITLMFLTSIFVYKYVKNESPVYIFDYSGYHETYKNFSKKFLETKVGYLEDVVHSVRNSDYNCTPIILLLPFYMIFKASRLGYILGSAFFYVVPTIILIIIITTKMLFFYNKEDCKNEKIFTLFLCMFSFLYTRWWSPTLRGLPDIIAIIPMLIATLIVLKYSFTEKQKIYIPIIVGFMMYLCFLFRRYFIYAIIGFYISLFIRELIRFFNEKENKKEKFFNSLKNFLISGFTTLLLVLVIQLPLVKNILHQDYSESYSAYQDTIANHIHRTTNEFGYIILFLAVIGIIYTLKNKKYRENGLFCILNIVVCYGTFMTVQAMGVHHYLTISPWVFILFIYGVYCIWSLLKNDNKKNIWLIIVLVFMSFNFGTTYIWRNIKIPFVTQNNKYCKFHYDNFDELERLIADIDKIISDKNVKFSALASSENLSDNILDLLGTENMKKSIVYTSAIDLRDGINFNSLMSEYIIVTDIPQTGTSSEGQRIVSVPNNEIMNGTSIGKAYTRISEAYVLQNNVKAYIYKKNRGFTAEEVNRYMEILEEYYPEWKENYSDFDKAVLMEERILGEKIGDVKRYKYDCFYMLPGFTPTIYTIKPNKNVEKLKLRLYIDENGVDTATDDYGKVKLTILKDGTRIYENNVVYAQPQEIELDLSNCNELQFIVDKDGNLSWDNLYLEIKEVICH